MAITADDVVAFLGGQPSGMSSARLLAVASQMVGDFCKRSHVPSDVLDEATLTLCKELDLRHKNAGGIVSWGGVDQAGVSRLNRDAMTAVYPLLSMYVAPF